MSRRRLLSIAVGLWLAAFAAALVLDRPVAEWSKRNALDKHSLVLRSMKSPGHFGFTAVVIAALLLWHPARARAAGLVLLSAATGGLLYAILKWIVGRRRPVVGIDPFAFHPFTGGLTGPFRAQNLSFPSGHACLAFATAAALAICLPRWRAFFYLAACVVGVERILENAHYVSDVLGGAAVGVTSAYLARWIGEKLFPANQLGTESTEITEGTETSKLNSSPIH